MDDLNHKIRVVPDKKESLHSSPAPSIRIDHNLDSRSQHMDILLGIQFDMDTLPSQ